MVAERTLESVTGERMVIKESTPDLLRSERHLPPKQRPVPKAAHPTQEAHLEVLEGRLPVTVGKTTRDYGAGESFTVPAGAFHSAWNVDAQPARVLVEFRPAEGILAFFEEMMGLTSMNLLGSCGSSSTTGTLFGWLLPMRRSSDCSVFSYGEAALAGQAACRPHECPMDVSAALPATP